MTGVHLEIHIESIRTLPTLHQADEEGSLIYLGQYLPRSVWVIKQYLMHPLVLAASVSGKPFLIYVWAMDHSLQVLLAKNNNQGYEQAIYYLSRTIIGAEHCYNSVEKERLALVFAILKIWHYLVGHTIHVISKVNPLRLLMMKPSLLNGRLAKWAILLL